MTAVAAVAAAMAAMSLVFLAINAAVFRPLRRAPAPTAWPRVSVVVPARNEERDLEAALRSHGACDYPDFEVIVVDDRSSDATARIAARVAAGDARFRVIAGEEPPPGWLGKPHALHEGAGRATGEWILFADADVRYAPGVLRRAVGEALDRRLDLLALLPRFESRGFWEGVVMPGIYAQMYLGPGFVTQIDAATVFAGGTGSGNLVRRASYEAAGGHAAIRDAVIDDIGLALAMKRAGFRTRAATAYDGVRVRMYRGLAEMVEGFSKNVAFLGPPAPAILVPLALVLLGWAPWVVLAGPAAARAKILAGGAIAATIAGRAAVARITRDPPWSALLHPLMLAVLLAIALRSWWRRMIRREVVWRGRRTVAPRARRRAR